MEEIFFKMSIPWSAGVLMNFCQRISHKAAFGPLNRMPRSMVMRSAKFSSIFCLFRVTYPSVGLAQHPGALTNTHVCTEACILTLSFLGDVGLVLAENHQGLKRSEDST